MTPRFGPAACAQPQRAVDVVDDEAGMRFERDLHAVLGGEVRGVAPVRNRLLLPLPLEHLEKLRRPRRASPSSGCFAPSESPGQPENVTTTGTSSCSARRTVLRNTSSAACAVAAIGMQRVAVARQRADRQAGVGDLLAVVGRARLLVEQRVEVEMIAARPAAGAELDRLDTCSSACTFASISSSVNVPNTGVNTPSFIGRPRRSAKARDARTFGPHAAAPVALENRVDDARRMIPVFEGGEGRRTRIGRAACRRR